MYKVIKAFFDLQDKKHYYNVGDEYPRSGLKPTKARIAELSGKENKLGVPLIEKVDDEKAGEAEQKEPEQEEAEK